MQPKDRSDFRERVRRETMRGKTTYFHDNIENYIFRQAKATTTFRVFSHWLLAYVVMARCMYVFLYSFPEMSRYGMFWRHPNYKKLGHGWSWFYFLRVPFTTWITWRLTKMLYYKAKDTVHGKEDRLSQLQNDWMYEDWHRDSEDGRYVNFRYGDHVDRVPEMSHHSNMIYKPSADKVKAALRFYKNGNDSFWDRLWKF